VSKAISQNYLRATQHLAAALKEIDAMQVYTANNQVLLNHYLGMDYSMDVGVRIHQFHQ